MPIKRVLLTGDDGYNAIGTRFLIAALKDSYDLTIAATKTQQSGVGGRLSLRDEIPWEECEIDGVRAIAVGGSPADAMEFSQGYFEKPFDLILSGVNLGANVTAAVVSSGTYSAVVRGLAAGVAPRGIALSWDAPEEMWHKKHDEREDISPYAQYPTKLLKGLLNHVFMNDLWGATILNINIPAREPKAVRMTRFEEHTGNFYTYPLPIHKDTHTFDYKGQRTRAGEVSPETDVWAVSHGFVSITPCQPTMLDVTQYDRLNGTQFSIE